MVEPGEYHELQSISAAEIMTPSPRTCSPFSTVLEAVMIFRDADCGAVPVLDDGKPVAILTDRDVALALSEIPDLVYQPLSAIVKQEVVSVAPGDNLRQVCSVLRSRSVRRVLVVDQNGALQGIIGWADIARVISERMMGRVVMDVVLSP
jgi:CBS domain-containing protein